MRGLLEKLSFAAGALGKRLHARLDLARAQIGVAAAENMVVLLEGGLTRRPGTRFILEHKDQTEKAALLPFRYDGTDSYMVAINGGYAWFLRQGGFIESVGVPYEIAVTWAEADLPNLRWSQEGNQMHVVCEGQAPRILTRADHASWSAPLYEATGGPFDTQNVDTTKTLQASAVTGAAITITAVGHTPFVASDIGTLWRLDEQDQLVARWKANETVAVNDRRRWDGRVYRVDGGTDTGPNAPTHDEGTERSHGAAAGVSWFYLHSGFGVVKVTGFTDSTHVTASVQTRLPESVVSGATFRWYPPAWSATRSWPSRIARYQRRLLFTFKNLFWFSSIEDSNDHDASAGGVTDAFSGRLLSQSGALVWIEWMIASGVLVVGTRDNEWVIRANNLSDALSFENIRAIEDSSEGSAPHVPAPVDGGALFIGRDRKRLHFAKFDRLSEGIQTSEVSVSNRELLKGLAVDLAFQRDPNRIQWIGCQNGALVGVTWMPEQQVVGLHVHPLANGYVESIRAIPSSDEGKSEIYMSVRRTINGATVRYYEQLMDFFEPLDPDSPTAEGAWFLDCALRFTGVSAAMTGATAANPVVISSVGHPFTNGMSVRPQDVGGMTELNNRVFTVANKTADTFELSGIDGAAFAAYTSGGALKQVVTTISNLGHLEAQECGVFADGAMRARKTVAAGAVTLDSPAHDVLVGIPIAYRVKSLPVEWPSDPKTSALMAKSAKHVLVRVSESAGGKIRVNSGPYETLSKTGAAAYGKPTPLVTGKLEPTTEAKHDVDLTWEIAGDDALPFTLLGAGPHADMEEEE